MSLVGWILTHGDPDHTGGLADFPDAPVHVSEEERARVGTGHWRYLPVHFAHGPRWKTYPPSPQRWFGHTLGHCGVAVRLQQRWLLHVGDAYYLRIELTTDDHPVSALAARRADDDALRRSSLAQLRRLARDHGAEIALLGYHDFTEFPSSKETHDVTSQA